MERLRHDAERGDRAALERWVDWAERRADVAHLEDAVAVALHFEHSAVSERLCRILHRLGRWQLASAGRTFTGPVRQVNEDTCTLAPPAFAVFDGMGGNVAGREPALLAAHIVAQVLGEEGVEVLAELSLEGATFERELRAELARSVASLHTTRRRAPAQRLAAVLHEVNAALLRWSDTPVGGFTFKGCGATGLVALADAGRLEIGHVGDVRMYRLRNGTLEHLTEDHRLINEIRRAGLEIPDDFTMHRVVTRALGLQAEIEPTFATEHLFAGDRLLLCSDGLHDAVEDTTLTSLLADTERPLEARCVGLVEAAVDAGSSDNISVLLVDVEVT